METAEKIRARTDALFALGLDQSASSDDIRNAWRNIAFHGHPDQADGDCSGFARAKEAYDLLRKEGLTGKGAGAGKPRRPKLRRRVITLEATDIDACRALLNKALPDRSDETEPSNPDQLCKSDHIPDAVGFFGRHVTFFVSTPVYQGANRVALPTSVLAGSRRTETEVLNFQSNNSGGGEVVVPDAITARTFPGAKSVRIRFDADQQMRDEFWLTH
ncbi:J domain-containing protein [Ruegeria sp. Ofav3-42]|uniref:J domain-containing protein n=1 Tax=Ruegeria sp. Ofav3-42 TaxID=2917759 RepID=UPI001EF45264|nr:J domain-containing protein [Ruegeria sp. Ofav3-42]MCG7519345.1 J domain-containing protein [Ruegeria sp. Ofav3-42]